MHEENKQMICDLLCRTLHYTRGAADVTDIQYDHNAETATVLFESGGKRVVNVAMDSGTAMIRDIMNNLGV